MTDPHQMAQEKYDEFRSQWHPAEEPHYPSPLVEYVDRVLIAVQNAEKDVVAALCDHQHVGYRNCTTLIEHIPEARAVLKKVYEDGMYVSTVKEHSDGGEHHNH